MMMRTAILVVLVALVATGARASEDPTTSLPGVKDLNPSTFDKEIDGSRGALIEFYAPWCGHCKHLTPEYKKLGETVAKDPSLNSRVVVAKVNADEHRELGERFQIRGFPTIKWFPRGRTNDAVDYDGARSADAMAEWIRKRLESDNAFAAVPSLAAIAKRVLLTDPEEGMSPEAALKEVTEAAKSLTDDADKENAKLYISYLEKAVKKDGREYIIREMERLQGLVGGNKVSPAKLQEIHRKLSVLESFKTIVDVTDEMEAEGDGYGDVEDALAGMDLGDMPIEDSGEDEYADVE